MTATTNNTKSTKVIAALKTGSELTAKQITARYGVKNVRALMSSLRMQGYPVYLNKRVSTFDGETKTHNKYRLGTPTRAVIAAGYRAIAQGV